VVDEVNRGWSRLATTVIVAECSDRGKAEPPRERRALSAAHRKSNLPEEQDYRFSVTCQYEGSSLPILITYGELQ
jgi:hypothetical protein